MPITRELLSPTDRANEYLMTSLRTARGCDLARLRQEFGVDLQTQRADYLRDLKQNHWATLHNEVLTLTDQGKLLADHITLELFQEAG